MRPGRRITITIALVIGIAGISRQIRAQTVAPEFDAASIKPSGQRMNGPVQFAPGRAFSNSVSAYRIILAAYNLKEYQLIGVKGWIESDWYALDARAEIPASEDQLRLMLRTLLSKRFGLIVHHERRIMPVYALVAGRNKTKLLPWNEGDPAPGVAGKAAEMNLSHETMASFVSLLNLPGFQKIAGVDRPVLDKTNLKGSYLVVNSWYDSWEDFQAAVIEDKMGLKLVPEKVLMDVLVIDHVDKPSAN